jgi:two-component system NarL family sensor kinase
LILKSNILISFILLCALYLNGQSAAQAPLMRELSLYDSLMNAGSKEAYSILMRANGMLPQAGTTKEQVRIYTANSRWYVELGQCDSTMHFAHKALSVSANAADSMRSLLAIGAAHRCSGSRDSSLAAYFQAERMALIAKDTFVLIRSYFYLGHVHSELGKYDKAANYYQLCSGLANASLDDEFIARSGLALASNMADRGLLKQSLHALRNALEQCKKAGLIRLQATAYNNLGLLCQALEMYSSALGYFRQSIEIQTMLGNQYEMATDYNNMAMILILQNRFTDAIPLLHKAEQLSPLLPEVYHNLALCYAETGNYKKAFDYKAIQKNLDDSLSGVEMLKRTEQLQEEFEAGKRQMEISTLKHENEVKELKNRVHLKQRDIFIGLASALFCISLLVFFILKQKVQNAKQVAEKNRQIHLQQLDEVMRNSELQSMHTMLDTQEKERRRIAEDLHDRVGSMLSAVKLRFTGLIPDEENKNTQKGEYEKLSLLIDETCEEIRMVSHNLVSGVLDTFGLVPALYDLREALSKSGLEVTITCHEMESRVPKQVEINLYRVFQELLNNTIRHAEATRADIEITRFREQLTVIYSDNGSGFDTAKRGFGIGLRSIQSRIDKLGGTLHIDSGKGNGSTFVITVNCHD